MKNVATLFLAILVFSNSSFGQEITHSVLQMKSDLVYLKNKLETKHPNLYIYNSKIVIGKSFDSLAFSITMPLTELEFYRKITTLSSKINDGHTIILPSKSITNYHNQNSKFLPYHFTIIDNKLYVDEVYTSDTTIPIGAEILCINAVSANDIIEQLTIRQIRDGYNTTYPLWILNNYFREYYSYIFGHPSHFDISYKMNAETQTTKIDALPKDSIYHFQDLKYSNRNFERKTKEGIILTISKEHNYAILTIKDFHNSVLRKEYHQNFRKTIKQYFETIQKSGVQNLILDLRDNQGGDIPNGALLVSYLLDKPFSIVQAYYKAGKDGLRKSNGQSLGTFKPKANSFKGELYVLINGGSFSNSGVVSSCLKRNNRGVFIGEETGGNDKVLAGYEKNIVLPNTKIRVQIPTRQFLLDINIPSTGHGTIPDFVLQKTLNDIINNTDNIMNHTTEIIKKKMQNNGR
jgi:hypothetical protein